MDLWLLLFCPALIACCEGNFIAAFYFKHVNLKKFVKYEQQETNAYWIKTL